MNCPRCKSNIEYYIQEFDFTNKQVYLYPTCKECGWTDVYINNINEKKQIGMYFGDMEVKNLND